MLSVHQFGFLKSRSVEDQLLVTYGEVVELVDKGFAVDMFFLDFSKAFDIVNHSIILVKPQMFGIGGRLLSWICEFCLVAQCVLPVPAASAAGRSLSSLL